MAKSTMILPLLSYLLILWLGSAVSVQRQALSSFRYPATCAPPNTTLLDPSLPPNTVIPPIPQLPDQFQLRVEANIIDKQTTWVAEEYVDFFEQRAAVKILKKNVMDTMLLDYKHNQIVYDINDNCTVTQLNTDANAFFFGTAGGNGVGIPHYSVLHFAISNGLLYKGTKIVRGINCDWWQSCMYWPNLLSNFTLDFYFTAVNEWTTADLSSQVPVMAEVQGDVMTLSGSKPFHHKYEYFDYRDRIWADDSVFNTPQGKVCPGREQTRVMPAIPSRYSFSVEIVDTGSQRTTQSDLYWDRTRGLVRCDYKPSFPKFPYYTTNPVTETYDFNTGFVYAIDNLLGNCSMVPIKNSTADVSSQTTINSNQEQRTMPKPYQIFNHEDNYYTYEGTRTVRNIPCDVFVAKRTDLHIQTIPNFESTVEYYFMNSQWTASSSGIASYSDVPIQVKVSTPDWVGYEAIYNIYNFNNEDHMEKFQVSKCYKESEKKAFVMTFPGNMDRSNLQHQKEFIRMTTMMISSVCNVSTIRIQDGRIEVEPGNINYYGTLLESPLLIQMPQSKPQEQMLVKAWEKLKTAVVGGLFQINIFIEGQNVIFRADTIDDNVQHAPQSPAVVG